MSRAILTLLTVCVLLPSFPSSQAAESPVDLGINPDELEWLYRFSRSRYRGLLVVRPFDAYTGEPLNNIKAQIWLKEDDWTGPHDFGRADWLPAGYHTYKFNLNGYISVRMDSIRVPGDSMVIVDLYMRSSTRSLDARVVKGTTTITYANLDAIMPKDEIRGEVVDGSNKSPVEGTMVFCEETGDTIVADSLGNFVVPLDTLLRVNLQVWHPQYDSIRFPVWKRLPRSRKLIHVQFEEPRRNERGKPFRKDREKSIVLLVDMWWWSNFGFPEKEFENRLYTYSVRSGDLFGPIGDWPFSSCLPFRLVRHIPDTSTWIQFVSQFSIGDSESNFTWLTDGQAHLHTRSTDGGLNVALSLQPPYRE